MELTYRTKSVLTVKMSLLRCRFFMLPVVLCISGACAAQENDCDPGVYFGKIGNVPVTISLDPAPDKTSEMGRSGSLYYRTSMVDMVLKQESAQMVWTEFDDNNKPSGRITLACQDKQLTGEWLSLDGRKRFPVAVKLSPDRAYHARRFSALKPIKAQTVPNSRSETFTVVGPKIQGSEATVIQGIQLFGTELGVAKVNRMLWANLLANTTTLLDCSLSFRQRFGEYSPALGFEQSLMHIAGPFVVVRSHIGFECGDGMGSSDGKETYRLTDGRKESSRQWFKPKLGALVKQEWESTLLAKLILKAGRAQLHKDDAECFEAAEYGLDDVYPKQEGFVFQGNLPEAFKFCRGTMDVYLPYASVAPFLSEEGKRAVQAIQKMPKQ